MADDLEKTSSDESGGSSGGLSDAELAELEAALFGTGIPDTPPKKKEVAKPKKEQESEPETEPADDADDAKHHEAAEAEIDSINEVIAPDDSAEPPQDTTANELVESLEDLQDALESTESKTSSGIGVDSDTLSELEEALKQAESDMVPSDETPVPEMTEETNQPSAQAEPPEPSSESSNVSEETASAESVSEIEAALMESPESAADSDTEQEDSDELPDDSIEVITVVSKRKISKKAMGIAAAVILVPILLYGIYRITAGVASLIFTKKTAVTAPSAQPEKPENEGTIIIPGKGKKGVAYVQEGTELEINGNLSAAELREKVKNGLMLPSDTKEIRVMSGSDSVVSGGKKTQLKGVVSDTDTSVADIKNTADVSGASVSGKNREITQNIVKDEFLSSEIEKKRAYYTRPYKNGFKVNELKKRVGLEELFESDYIFLVREELENHSLEDCYELMLVEFPDGTRKYIDSKFYIPITIDGNEIIYDSREVFLNRLKAEK